MQPNQSLDELDLFLHCLLLEQSMAFQRQLLGQQLRRYPPKNYAVRYSFLKLIYSYFSPFNFIFFLRTVSSLIKVKDNM